MRRVLVALAWAGAAALVPSATTSDSDLTSLVNSAYFPRTETAQLHDLAHQRAQFQVAHSGGVCFGDDALTHVGLSTAEVLSCNFDGPAKTLEQWVGSPVHDAILSDRSLTRLGCGSASGLNGAVFYVCVLTVGSSPIPMPDPAPAPAPAPAPEIPPAGAVVLPNTAVKCMDR